MKLTKDLGIYQHNKTGGWSVRVKIGKQWVRRGLGTQDKDEAVEKAFIVKHELMGLYKNNHSINGKDKTVNQYISKFEESTDTHKRTWARRIKENLGKTKMKELNYQKIGSFLKDCEFNSKPPYAYATRLLRQIMEEALLDGEILSMPKIPAFTQFNEDIENSRREGFSEKEIKTIFKFLPEFINKVETKPYTHYSYILFHYFIKTLLNSGLRTGEEVQNITWNHLSKTKDYVNTEYEVEEYYNEVRAVYNVKIVAGKTSKYYSRTIPIDDEVLQQFLYVAQYKIGFENTTDYENIISYMQKHHGTEPIFCGKKKQKIDFGGIFKSFKEYILEKYKISFEDNPTLYVFRHTYINNQLDNNKNVDMRLIAKLLGTSIEVIQKYYDHRELRDKTEAILNKEFNLNPF